MREERRGEADLELLEYLLTRAKRTGDMGPPLSKEQQEVLWRSARHHMGRREFLRLLTLGGAAAVMATFPRFRALAAAPGVAQRFGPFPALPPARTEASPWVKDLTPLYPVNPPFNYELRYENLKYGELVVPTRYWYLRGLSAAPIIDHTKWRLKVEGPGVERTVELTFEDLLRMPSRNQNAYMECSGNGRSFFRDIMKRPGEGIQWRMGSQSQANWEGVSIGEILQRAGLRRNAAWVNFIGLDPPTFQRPIPIEEALRPDNLIVYGMNGEWLPFDHGWPARAVIPRWTAVASVKWLGRIYVDVEPIWVELNTLRYIMEGPGFAAVGRARGIPLTTTWIKSALALKWIYPDDLTPHELKAGPNRIRGYAWSPSAKIAKVMYAITPLATLGEWTTVDPARVSWREAKLSSVQKSEVEWVRFDFVWDARPGLYGILTRATDQKGNTQPLEMPTWNKFGYAWNRPVAHPVRVV